MQTQEMSVLLNTDIMYSFFSCLLSPPLSAYLQDFGFKIKYQHLTFPLYKSTEAERAGAPTQLL